ncbi:DNA polymerase I [uncultured Muribaculum sp.]|uniref:DNA polymerase I n=1 Tax=uncultured Muribaculum sp. TaxID=1918613 RepID=UPI002609F724|nr:DNA polymerase I [uncultured Muribaculum sp.]
METEKKLFLLDAYALVYRAYYALINAPRMTSSGFNTSAIYGFVNTLQELLRTQQPTHIAVCFDPHGPTFRHEAYQDYKAQRDKQPEDITQSIPIIKDIINAYGIEVVEVEGYEADDVIGTLSRKAETAGFTTYMMTPDKDYGQLVTDKVFMYKPGTKGSVADILGPEQICEKHGIESPLQVIDLLALEGDSVDNIPGCPGVGPKTAAKLIQEWNSVENLLENTGQIKGALQKKLADNAEQIRFSKFLATICTDAPIEISPDQFSIKAPDYKKLESIFNQLEFRQLAKRLPAHGLKTEEKHTANTNGFVADSLFDMHPAENSAPAKHQYTAGNAAYKQASSPEDISGTVAQAQAAPHIGVAVYAVGDEDMTASWMGIALSAAEGEAAYIPITAFADERADVISRLRPLFENSQCSPVIVSHDVKRLITMLRREGIALKAPYYDTSVAHYLLEPEMNHSLARVAAARLNYHTSDFTAETDRVRRRGEPIPPGQETLRAGEAADITLRLYTVLRTAVDNEGLTPLMADIELPLIAVLASMEWEGVRIDNRVMEALQRNFSERLAHMEAEAYRLAGKQFNIASPSQVGEILFGQLALDPKAKRTKKGSYSTTEEILDKYRDAHPLVGLILEIRGLRKLLTTYVEALPQLVNKTTGKIHTSFNQTVTATGRISSANPNLQNIPIRTGDGREIRRAFIPGQGHLLLSADYSQIELRVIADISHDPEMTEAFLSDTDIHRSTASKIYHVPLEQVTDEQRRRAKTANFGIIYGISAFGLSQRLHISRQEAKELIDGYFRTYPHIQQYIEHAIEDAREKGHVTTIMGRKRMLPDINSRSAVVRGYAERNAVNAPIQGSAADIIKLAMVRIYNEFNRLGLKSKMIIQVHDELIFDVVPDELPVVQETVTRLMTGAHTGAVPMEVAAGVGSNWLEAH